MGIFWSCGVYSWCSTPQESKKPVSIILKLLRTWWAFFGLGDVKYFHFDDWESHLNLLNGFHLAVALFLAKYDAVAQLQSFYHFSYNENLTRALKTTSLNCCFPSTDAIDRQEKNSHGSRSPHASERHWNPSGFRRRKRLDTFLTEWYIKRNLSQIFVPRKEHYSKTF